MYIKGACKDEEASFPQLRRCRVAATDLHDPEHGAGVSVGRWFRNVNWVAVPGYDLFYQGNLKFGEPLTQEHFDATVRDVVAKGVYNGVKFHASPSVGAGASLEDFISQEGIGTDLALQFARSVFCARVPVTEPMLIEIIAFLNDKNREYFEGEADYNWDVWADNCVHTLRNALAAANIWSPLSVQAVKLRQIFNLAIPANEFVNLAEISTKGNIEDYREIQRDGPQRDTLHEFHWLPTRHGALLKTLPVHEPNELYDTTFRLFTLQSPFRMGKTQRAIDLLSDERFVNLDANLRYFREKYDTILASHDEARDRLASVRGTPHRRTRAAILRVRPGAARRGGGNAGSAVLAGGPSRHAEVQIDGTAVSAARERVDLGTVRRRVSDPGIAAIKAAVDFAAIGSARHPFGLALIKG